MTGTAPLVLPQGQGLAQLGLLGLAAVLSALLGLERELRNKSAGLRTHTLVGVGAALFMLVSKYGFFDVIESGRISLDPSRVAAQVASGIGFIGGGLIFVRRDAVRGLTTAAVVWVTAAVGLACGAGLPLLAVAVTAGHFIVVYGLGAVGRRLPESPYALSQLRLTYLDGTGALGATLQTCTVRGFVVVEVSVERAVPHDRDRGRDYRRGRAEAEAGAGAREPDRTASVTMQIRGMGSVAELTAAISEIPGVMSVSAGDANLATE
jgi:putative Mg2+ transporter-C (MgtC) family protein